MATSAATAWLATYSAPMRRGLEGQAVGPIEGPYTEGNHLASGISTVMLIRDLFNEDATWRGDVPCRIAPPINPQPPEREENRR